MDADYITALQYARKHERTKQWVIRLCHAGRIEGAYMAGGVWVMPADAELPKTLRPGPKPSFDRVLAVAALDRARQIKKETKAMLRDQVDEVGTMLHPQVKAAIDHWTAQGAHYDAAGNCWKPSGAIGMPPDGWNGTAWLYAQSVKAGKPVLSAPSVKEWPSNTAEWDRKEDIREGVLGEEPMTLEEIKAKCGTWGKNEQAYYEELRNAANKL